MSPYWGALSDRVGRRPVMLFSLVASACWIVLFGSATNLHVALFCRFANGLTAGNVVVAKSMMADLTDRSNEAKAFTFFGMTYGCGTIFGSLIGGPLSFASDKYNLPGRALWAARPFLLPCLVVATYIMIDWVLALLLLEETHESRDASDAAYGAVESEAEALGLADEAGDADAKPSGVGALLRDPTSPFMLVCVLYAIMGTCVPVWNQTRETIGPGPLGEYRHLTGLRATASPNGKPR